MTKREAYISVYMSIMQGYTSRVSPFFSDANTPEQLKKYADEAAKHAIENMPVEDNE